MLLDLGKELCGEIFQEPPKLPEGVDNPRSQQPACPDPTVWYEIAGGVTTREQAEKYFEHAVVCDHCRPLLRQAVSDFHDETTPVEATQLADLESAQPEWQRELVQKITGKPVSNSPPASWWRWKLAPRLALVTVAVLVAVVGYRFFFRANPYRQTGRLLASAYSQKRPLKFRVDGMPYAPVGEGMQRNAESSFLSRPESLLQAEVLIAKQLAANPSDPLWLQVKARADLLEGKYAGAVESLQHALQLSPKSTEIMIDLATAYCAVGKYDAAYETLSKALALKPDDPVALFNRAIVAEQLHLYHQALDDADRYLQLDSHSKWADEARALAASIRELLKKHDQSQAEPLLTPAEIAASANDPALRSKVDERVEEYLKEAVVSWLPRVYPTKSAPDPAARHALFFLADLTREKHKDLWLADLLRGSSAPNFPQAVEALARAVRANDIGEYDTVSAQSIRAEQLFRAEGNVPGVLRAQFEKSFAAQIQRQSDECRQRASGALTESQRYSYPWLQIQLGLEKGVCSFLMGDIGSDEKTARDAANLAQTAGYGGLFLRALFFRAEDKLATGDRRGASELAITGLEHYWSNTFHPRRGYSLYTELAFVAEGLDQPGLRLATWREAVALIDSDQELLQRAMAHELLANAATVARQFQIAEQQYAEASRLFELAPHTAASKSAALENEIRFAQLEGRLGHFDAATERLISIQERVRPLSNADLVRMFYSTLGELQLGRHLVVEAEQALRPALALAEQNLASIHSEGERITWSKGVAPICLGLAEAELGQGRIPDAVEIFEWYLGASQRENVETGQGFHTNLPVPHRSRLASRLPLLSRETVVAYGLLPGGLAIWVYDDRGINAQWVPGANRDLEETAARFYDLTSNPKSDLAAVRRDAKSLYQSLISPVEQNLVPGRTLVIEAEGPLANVPFQALLDPHGHYLVERWPIVYSLGQDSDVRLRRDGLISADLPALIVGSTASSPAQGLISLPNVAAEADTVAASFFSSRVLKADEASLNTVRNELPAAAVFHFAGHSLSTPERAGLLLEGKEPSSASPSLLDADTLRRLRLPTLQLAFLSACSTASDEAGAAGLNSVTEAFLRAGVPHVVASRWAVDSVETRVFVEDFYRNALSGQSIADSIRLTARRMLSDRRTAHPYYWAAFAAYGRP